MCDYGAVQAIGSAASRGRDRCHSEELGFRLSRFNRSSWVSFSSQKSQEFESKYEDPVDGSSQRGDAEDPDRWVLEEVVVQSSEQHEVIVPSRAWVDEVKTLKQGDVHVGRRTKQRGQLPSFWANRYKASKFGRDTPVQLHRAEVQEDPRYGLKVHELSGKRLLRHCRPSEKCHAHNLRDLFRDRYPHAFDPNCSERLPLSSELNILEKAQGDRGQRRITIGGCRGRRSTRLAVHK